ncbi:rRNA maturation RNase YbeY [Immundisolibacter sp.]|uniref:rRNA maturation RNase YbeY n=1 Tax=Immundisolibacter sp. TaxID=1934948 RepID=UPI003565C1C1
MSATPIPPAIEVDIDRASTVAAPLDTVLNTWVQAAASQLPAVPLSVAVRLVDTAEATSLNRDYRGKDYAPNVLSFPLHADFPLPPDEPRPLGDVVLCLPVVQAEAATYGKSFEQRLAHLLIHGVLHLAGHSHDEPSEREAMEAAETAVMARLGYPDPYTSDE